MLVYSIFFLLLSNSVTLRRDKAILFSRNAMDMLLYTLIILLNGLDILFLEKGLGIFGGFFCITNITQNFHLFLVFISIIIIQLTSFYPRKIWHEKFSNFYDIIFKNLIYNNTNITNKMGEQYKIIEYPLILLFIITGGLFLISCNDIISIFLSIELQSYGLYILSTIYRNSELSTSAGLTYFLLGGLSSCFILLGTSLLYSSYGTTNLEGYFIINNICNYMSDNAMDKPLYLNISLLIMSVGFLFKISAAPFHFWSPDVYDGIPTIVTTFVAIIAKISIFIFLLGFIYYTNDLDIDTSYNWKFALLFSSLLSFLVGSILGLTQFRIKRLLAYSTISHIGFMLLALTINSTQSIEAFIFYLVQYTISNLNAFFILVVIGYSLYIYINKGEMKEKYLKLLDRNYSPIQLISQIKGYYYINPLLALSLAITLFSFVGIPPLVGFFAKQMVLSAALEKGFVFFTLIAIITSVISAIYYLNIIKQMFFEEKEYILNESLKDLQLTGYISDIFNKKIKDAFNFDYNSIILSSCFTLTISILTLILFTFLFYPYLLVYTYIISVKIFFFS